jgi:hypothetical protein
VTETTTAETCRVEGCPRPVSPEIRMGCCVEHGFMLHAAASVEEWNLALSILRPFHEMSKHVGSPLVEVAMEKALEVTESDLRWCRERLEQVEAEAEA